MLDSFRNAAYFAKVSNRLLFDCHFDAKRFGNITTPTLFDLCVIGREDGIKVESTVCLYLLGLMMHFIAHPEHIDERCFSILDATQAIITWNAEGKIEPELYVAMDQQLREFAFIYSDLSEGNF